MSSSVPKPCVRSSKGNACTPSLTPSPFPTSALRKWVYRFASHGTQGLVDRPRSGRPPKITCELERYLNHLVDQDPLEHGSIHSQWSGRERATGVARATGVQLGRESVRGVLQKTR